jgi:hypothetical protein
MRKKLLLMSALMAAGLQLGCAPLPIRIETITPFPPKTQTHVCDNNGTCKVVVYARATSESKCEVMAEYYEVRVAAGWTPTMMWEINPIDTGHPYDYRFALEPSATPPVYGIEILGNTPQDFANPDYGRKWIFFADDTKFKWDDRHQRSLPSAPFDYNLHVLRSPHNKDDWSTECDKVDPRIVND